MILACVAGLLANELTFSLPEFAWVTWSVLDKTALPISLLAIGAGLSLDKFSQGMSLNIYSSLMQMVVKPMIAFVVISATGLAPEFGVLIFLMMAPPQRHPATFWRENWVEMRRYGLDDCLSNLCRFWHLADYADLMASNDGVRLA